MVEQYYDERPTPQYAEGDRVVLSMPEADVADYYELANDRQGAEAIVMEIIIEQIDNDEGTPEAGKWYCEYRIEWVEPPGPRHRYKGPYIYANEYWLQHATPIIEEVPV